MSSSVDVRDAVRLEPAAPIAPGRFRAPLCHRVDDIMPLEWQGGLAHWLHEHRYLFAPGGDDEGHYRVAHDLVRLEDHAAALAGELRSRILELVPDALEGCGVPDFDVRGLETHASLFHHGGHWTWHDDVEARGVVDFAPAMLGFELTLRTDPAMFQGGELELLDGTVHEPANGRLVFLHPAQRRRVRVVECWSALALHGRWSVEGVVRGIPPDGWNEALQNLAR